MSRSINKVQLLGNIGRDPEVRSTQDGRKVVSFSMATSETWKDKRTGEKRESTEWHRIVIFAEGLVDVAERYLKKGSKVLIEGTLKTRKYEKDGVDHYSTEIVVSQYEGQLILLSDPPNLPSEGSYGGRTGRFSGDIDDDEIPY